MTDYQGIPDDQIRAWIAFAHMRSDHRHLAKLRRVLAVRAGASEPADHAVAFRNDDATVYETDQCFVIKHTSGVTTLANSFDTAMSVVFDAMLEA